MYLPQTQQLCEGTPNCSVSAHSWPGIIAPLAQCPSLAYLAHVAPNWFFHPGVSEQTIGATCLATGSTSFGPPTSKRDAAAAAASPAVSLPHAQQCRPAAPQFGAAAHSWPAAKPVPVQWPSVTKLLQREWNLLVQPGVSVHAVAPHERTAEAHTSSRRGARRRAACMVRPAGGFSLTRVSCCPLHTGDPRRVRGDYASTRT